jgi:hypothetical protein
LLTQSITTTTYCPIVNTIVNTINNHHHVLPPTPSTGPHAAPLGGGVCQDNYPDRSNAFCSKYASACKDDGTAYSDCKAEAAKMILGKFGDTAGARTHARTHALAFVDFVKKTVIVYSGGVGMPCML